ncbi:MAG: SusD/RagB family nutrient-binding outer membrane lipoprotein [Bacteroidales bacterium]|nr:SusD/RagB family nutrient-binding outer membrane lipoprotein [Bacteroidales bacterium]
MKKILIFISVLFVLAACSKLEDLNVNTKAFTSATGPSVFNGTVRAFFNQMATFNVNQNNTELFVQHFTETTYLDESRYDMVTRPVPQNHNNIMYRNVLMNLKEAKRLFTVRTAIQDGISQGQRDNQLAIVEIMSIFAWSNVIETFGDMPYSEALDILNVSPKYDDAFTVYKDLIVRLDAALASMDAAEGGMGATFDNIYNDDVAMWIKFGNSLKLRMGLMLADKDATLSQTTVNSAITAGVFTSGEKFSLEYLGASPNQNPVYTELVVSGRSDFVVANTLADACNATNDPRRVGFMWTQVGGIYKGGVVGKSSGYTTYSHVDNSQLTSEREVVLMDYVEVEFLLAEAAARGGYTGAGVAATHYANAVTESITNWGGTSAEAATYLAQPTVDYATLIATQPWKQVIGTQAWIAYYMRGFSAWTSWRRLDYPRLIAAVDHVQDVNGIPQRYSYPISEQTLNHDSWAAAVALMTVGGDNAMTPLFWDTVHYNTLTGADV